VERSGPKWPVIILGRFGAGTVQIFRGSYQASIDDKGRLKLPVRLKQQVEEWFGSLVFVTSLAPHELRIYPMAAWEDVERRFLSHPAMNPLVSRLMEHANYGQDAEMDAQGRVLIPALLREVIQVNGEVVVSGRGRFLAVVSRERAQGELATAFTMEELAALAALEQ